MSWRRMVLRVIAITLLVGGVVRLGAGQGTFEAFAIGELWSDHAYFIYIYRVLGAFVVLLGIVFLAVASDPGRYPGLLAVLGLGFGLVGLVMLAAGLMLRLPLEHFLPDPVYCLVVAAILVRLRR